MSGIATVGSIDASNEFAEALKRFNVPGAVFARVEGKRQDIITAGVLNLRTGAPVSHDSLFQIGSITKAYTATLVHQLADEGKLDIEDKIYIHLPKFAAVAGERYAEVTLRQLLNHTSGIDGDCFVDTGRGDECIGNFEDVAAKLFPLHQPGEMFSYCNTGYVLAGRIVEKITGQYWRGALQTRILQPLDASRTLVLPEAIMRHSFAVGHQGGANGAGMQVIDPLLLPRSNEPAGSTPWSDMAGLLAFARCHWAEGLCAHGNRLISKEAARLMCRWDIDCPSHEPFSAWGPGWALFDWEDQRFFGHDGLTRGQAAFLRIKPDTGLILAMFANGGDMRGLFMEMAGRALGKGPGFAPSHKFPPPSFSGPLENYVGVYSKFSDALRLTLRSEGLHLQVEPRNDPVGIVKPISVVLQAISKTVFVGHITDVSTPVVLNFSSFDPDKRPQRVHMHLRAYGRDGL